MTHKLAQQLKDIANGWLDNKAALFLNALKAMPTRITATLAENMKNFAPIDYYKALSWAQGQTQQSHIAMRFGKKRNELM